MRGTGCHSRNFIILAYDSKERRENEPDDFLCVLISRDHAEIYFKVTLC